MAIQTATDADYQELIKEDFVIVDFYSTTCVPCKMFSKILADLEGEIPFINIVKVNTTDYPELGKQNGIQAVPTVKFFKDGKLLETHVGVIPYTELKDKIAQYLYA